jgi:hypothetical protein
MIRGIKKWFKGKTEEVSFENITCKNCETNFDGKFCPECGQSVKDYDRPFSFVFYNFAGDFFSFDARFFRTFTALVVKPGFLTKEYFAGRRIKYAPPFRIFIFVSFILFLLLQIYTTRGLTTVLNSEFDGKKIGLDSTSLAVADSLIEKVYTEIDSAYISTTDSVGSEMDGVLDSVGENKLNLKINKETLRDTRDLRTALNKIADWLETELEKEEDPKQRLKLRMYISNCRSPEQAMAKILKYLSWTFFLLLPIFALILKLVFIRGKHNYMRHLIFSIHFHSFIFLVLILIVSLFLLFKGNLEVISIVLLFSITIYFIIALKKFYKQKTGKAILKYLAVYVIYVVVFIAIVGFVNLKALGII